MTDLCREIRRRSNGPGVRNRGRLKRVVVELKPPNLIYLRLERERKGFYLTAEVAYVVAVNAEVQARKNERIRARKAAKKARATEALLAKASAPC